MTITEGSPFALDAEQAIVAALFGDRATELFDRIVLEVKEEDFYFKAHAVVFQAFAKMVEEGITPDAATLSSRIKSSYQVDDETRSVLAEAAAYPYVADNVEVYAKLVAEKATARRVGVDLARIGKKIGLVGGEMSASDLLAEVEAVAQERAAAAQTNELLLPIDVRLANALDWLERKADGKITGIETGLVGLDKVLGGIEDTDMVVIAARPSMGKSALALNIAKAIATREDKDDPSKNNPLVAIFSLEMSENQIMLRFFSNFGSIDHDKLRRSSLDDEDYDRLGVAVGEINNTGIRIDCDGELKPSVLRAKLRMLLQREKRPLGAVFVDYLQLMDPDRVQSNKATDISEISRKLKAIAKEFKAPVFALSQLNRGVEQRPNKRPLMSDLRESGAIEQDADIIIMLYRDEYYNPDTEQKGITELIVTKHRNGSTATVPAMFVGNLQRFADVDFVSGYRT